MDDIWSYYPGAHGSRSPHPLDLSEAAPIEAHSSRASSCNGTFGSAESQPVFIPTSPSSRRILFPPPLPILPPPVSINQMGRATPPDSAELPTQLPHELSFELEAAVAHAHALAQRAAEQSGTSPPPPMLPTSPESRNILFPPLIPPPVHRESPPSSAESGAEPEEMAAMATAPSVRRAAPRRSLRDRQPRGSNLANRRPLFNVLLDHRYPQHPYLLGSPPPQELAASPPSSYELQESAVMEVPPVPQYRCRLAHHVAPDSLPNDGLSYDVERFVSQVPKDLVCVICLGVMNTPVETTCAHVFCARCITEALRHRLRCPVDRRPLLPTGIRSLPRIVHSILAALQLRCRFPECGKVVALEQLASHEATCELAWRGGAFPENYM